MSYPRSPLAPDVFPSLPAVSGVSLATVAAGIRKRGRDDLLIAHMAPGSAVAATLTSSACPAAPIEWCRKTLEEGDGSAEALVCNSGNANAFTGKSGMVSTEKMAEGVSSLLGVSPRKVMVASTGVIGEPMPDDRIAEGIRRAGSGLVASGPDSWEAAAGAIRTTDTFSKAAWVGVAGTRANIVGIAKGSGMIAPDMATMLGFLFTDLAVSPSILQASLARAVSTTFNRITVDSDTSTNDAVLLFATGQSGDEPIADGSDPRLESFQEALDEVCLSLAKQIVRDGEGATKLVSVTAAGAVSEHSALKIARSIAESPLVKTALAAEDANWGRIVMAVGKAGEPADRDQLAIWIGRELVASAGRAAEGYSEAAASAHLKGDEVNIRVDVGVGEHEATMWTCDLTHGYIEINAGYRT